jgi:REP element-mobilizing transposase RayT
MNRGARKEAVFLDAASCERFVGLLAELPGRFGVTVHGYALMPNHFHVLLTAGPRGLGPSMKYLQGEYSRWLNAEKSWDGPVWRARYRSRPVDSEDYWRHLLAYVHLNPVKGRLVPKVGHSIWTSHAAYAGTRPVPDWLRSSPRSGPWPR